jgi:hypothetical protein
VSQSHGAKNEKSNTKFHAIVMLSKDIKLNSRGRTHQRGILLKKIVFLLAFGVTPREFSAS